MQISELARILRNRYDEAPEGGKAVEVVMFGVEYASVLKMHSTKEVADLSGIGKWGPQVALGINLSERVSIK